jgi:hypothetical protein
MMPPLIAQSEFCRQDVPRVVASIVATAQATYAFAPAAFALVLASGQALTAEQSGQVNSPAEPNLEGARTCDS